jgi:hypothetical protein
MPILRQIRSSSLAAGDSFEPKQVLELAAGGERKVAALVTPAPKAINGDCMVSMTASGTGCRFRA